MARVARTRTRTGESFSGSMVKNLLWNGAIFTSTPSNISLTKVSDYCTDSVGRPVSDSAFDCKSNKGILRVNGFAETLPRTGISYEMIFNDYPVGTAVNHEVADPPPSGWYLDLVAGTNPSRPVVTPPTLLQDLIELPSMIKQVGDLKGRPLKELSLRDAASAHLLSQFGWIPLIDDLKKLMDLQAHILKRMKELEKLSAGGLRRRLRVKDVTSNTADLVGSYGAGLQTVDIYRDTTVSVSQWSTIRWYPLALPSTIYHPDNESNHDLARRLVLGLTPEGIGKGIWDVIPWTWLLGWFTNVGKFALASSNTVPASHGTGCFMSKKVTTYRLTEKVRPGVRAQLTLSGKQTRSHLTRTVSGSLIPGFNVPFIDTSRMLILDALFIQRIRRL